MTSAQKLTEDPAIPDNSKMIKRTHESVAEIQGAINETMAAIEASKAKLADHDQPKPA